MALDTETQIEIGASVCAGGLVLGIAVAVFACRYRKKVGTHTNWLVDNSESSEDSGSGIAVANQQFLLPRQTSQPQRSEIFKDQGHTTTSFTNYNSPVENVFDPKEPVLRSYLGICPDYSTENLTIHADYSKADDPRVNVTIDADYSTTDDLSLNLTIEADYSTADELSINPDYSTDEELDNGQGLQGQAQQARPFSYVRQESASTWSNSSKHQGQGKIITFQPPDPDYDL